MATISGAQSASPVQVHRSERDTMIEDLPQISIRRNAPRAPRPKSALTSPMSDDFPTPKAIPTSGSGSFNSLYTVVEDVPASPASSDTQSDRSSMWSKRSSRSEFDELYDLSASESDDFPIKLSSSVKKRVGASKPRYPSIAIPSPSQWPTIQKLQSTIPLSPQLQVQLSPRTLQKLQQQNLQVPSNSGAPSLDGSLTSEELAISSCPSTPDLQNHRDGEDVWGGQIRLDPSAMSLLQQITPEQEQQEHSVIEVSEEAMAEMREIVDSPSFLTLKLDVPSTQQRDAADTEDQLSALSVPSPGGFFSSLDSSLARSTWSSAEPPNTSIAAEFYGVPFRTKDSALPTSTATSFYGLPWASRPENTVEQVVSTGSVNDEKRSPVTARRILASPTAILEDVAEIDETYEDTLKVSATVNIDRTNLWLSSQKAYLEALCSDSDVAESFKDIDGAVPKTPDQPSPASADNSPNSKKSVRFAESLKSPATNEGKRVSPIHDGTFWQGWCHQKRSQRARDVFQHRQMRAEAEHVRRNSAGKNHLGQLQGKFEITTIERPAPARPVSTMLPAAVEDEKKEIIARAERERQALEQLQPSSWHIAAQKELHGGHLLTSPTVTTFKRRKNVQILDLAGQVHCGWAWDVAASHPHATVYTTVSTDVEAHVAESTIGGPSNHRVVAAPNLWDLPFEAETFDVVSARNLYMHLRTCCPKGESSDEWDLALRECTRVLKKGGYLEFDLLDAELVHPQSASQALGVEFAFNLKTRGYDPCSGKSFLPRLKRAGFQDIKRAWMVLPVADIAPRWTDANKASPSSGSTVTPGSSRSDYFGHEAAATPVRVIGPNGSVDEMNYYEPPVTGSTKDVRAMTGLLGARVWEQWMMKLNCELGRGEERCLEGVAKALEEGGKGSAGWKCLVGWARKTS